MDGWIDLNFDFLSQSISQTSSQSANEPLSLKNIAAFCIPNVMQCATQLIFMKAKSTTNNNRYNQINKAPHKSCSFHYNLFCIVLYLRVCVCVFAHGKSSEMQAHCLQCCVYDVCMEAKYEKIKHHKKWNQNGIACGDAFPKHRSLCTSPYH